MEERPKKDQVGVRLPEDLLARIDQMAKDQTRNRSNMVEVLIRRALEAEDREAAQAATT